jgi:hypothetical protein
MKVFAYYYPGFFNDTYRVSGTEWNVVKSARPRSLKHDQPRVPSAGYYDQTDFDICCQQIKLASKYGIDGFMVCFYWDFETSKPVMNEPLEQLMKAIVGTEFQFNVMWVLRLPHKELPIQNGAYGKYQNHPWFKKRIQKYKHDEAFIHYLNDVTSHPNYRKDREGRSIVQVYSVSELLELHGEETVSIFEYFKKYHLQGVCGRSDEWISDAHQLGLSSLTTYVTLVDFNAASTVLAHKECVEEQPTVWKNIKKVSSIPFYPSVSSGWDASPRGSFEKGFRLRKFPWSPVVIDANPEDFGKNLQLAKKEIGNEHVDLHLASWNEWSEGHYVEPDLVHGTTFLEQIALLKKLI